METVNATEVRKHWSTSLDTVSRTKPLFVKRTRDTFMLSDLKTLQNILSAYEFNAHIFTEDDGSYTISLEELDLLENAETKEDAIAAMKLTIYEYATDFYNEFDLWSSAPNRKSHVPYVLKALLCNNPEELELNIIDKTG